MLRHVVVLSLKPEAGPVERRAIVDSLRELPAEIPFLRGYEVGEDVGLDDGNGHVVLVADLDDEDAWRQYQDHPEHRRVLRDVIRPNLAHRAAVQYVI